MNFISNLSFFYKRKIEPGFKISKNALVIDIGSGDKPFWRADVYLDKLSLGNVQRTSKSETIHSIGKFVDADVKRMPFKDKAFDFSFCSHLLEHVDSPANVIKEITRISKSGYVEVPNGILETIQPFNSHLWFVFQDKDKLIFFRKSKKLHDVLSQNGQQYIPLLGKVNSPFIRMYWKKNIQYEVIDNYKHQEKFESEVSKPKPNAKTFSSYLLLIKIIRRVFYRDKDDFMEKILNK